MTDSENQALEGLLRQAKRRPAPAAEETALARAAVRDEWRRVTGRRRARRLAGWALAATVLAGIFAAFTALRVPSVDPVQVATIEKSIGPVFLLGDDAELRATDNLSLVLTGQTIVTGKGAALALEWRGGGSLRIDANTRVQFADAAGVFLAAGRVYFDTRPATVPQVPATRAEPDFVVRTAHGEVRHLGTQYMARVENDALVVSVREGSVVIDGTWHQRTARPGEQVTLRGAERPTVLDIGRSGGAWDWIGRTTPAADMEGRTLHEFLLWACRELGLELRFEGGSEAVARKAVLRGRVDTGPADALRLRLASAALDWRIDEEVIYISD